MKMTPPAKPGEAAKEKAFTLAEGERDGEVEVLEIDEKEGTVKVNNSGTVVTLNFKDDGVKTASGPAPGPGAPQGMPPQMRRRRCRAPSRARLQALRARSECREAPCPPCRRRPQATRLRRRQRLRPPCPARAQAGAPPAAQPTGFSSVEDYTLLMEFNRIQNQPLEEAGLMPPLPKFPGADDARAAILGTMQDQAAAAAQAAAPTAAPVTLPLPGRPQPLPPPEQQLPPQAPQ